MSLEQIKKEGIAFFSEAIKKWNRLIQILNEGHKKHFLSGSDIVKGNKILAWFQENYDYYVDYSNFKVFATVDSKDVRRDPIFDVIFRGGNTGNIYRNSRDFIDQLNMGAAHFRGHLSSIKNLKSLPKESRKEQVPLFRIRKILSRFYSVTTQLKRRQRNRSPYTIKDEYDVQDLLHALLKLDFKDIRTEEWTPTYAGGASRIDFLLKKEGILIEAKNTRADHREKQIGKELIVDIARYKEYPEVNTLVCFIYDPEHWIGNPKGLEHDLEKLSTEKLNVEAIISPRES